MQHPTQRHPSESVRPNASFCYDPAQVVEVFFFPEKPQTNRMPTIYYSPSYVAAEHAFSTTRKAGWVADSLQQSPIEGILIQPPEPLTCRQLLTVHSNEYVQAVATGIPRSRASSQGFEWGPQLLPAVLASNGGVVAAALQALKAGVSGSLSSGLHHAHRNWGSGFCTFNGLAIAAHRALEAGAESVLILDLDAHCGGGTAAIIQSEPRIKQVDVSVCEFDEYADTINSTLTMVDGVKYLATIERALAQCETQTFDLCLYNAGMDPFKDDVQGGVAGVTMPVLARREALVFDWCRRRHLPVAFVLAGGYVGGNVDVPTLVALHRLTLQAAAGVLMA